MALTRSTITGRVPLPTDQPAKSAELIFALSGFDTEGSDVVIPARVLRVGLEPDGSIPAGVMLWRNTEGLRGTHYVVTLEWVEPGRRRSEYNRREAALGWVQIGDAASYTLAQLLNAAPVPPPPNSYWSSITQEQYDEVMAAVIDADRAEAAADRSEVWAGAAEYSATLGSLGAQYKVHVAGDFPVQLSGYAGLLATYGYSYIYPQAFLIKGRQLWRAHLVSGGVNNFNWFDVIDLDTKETIAVFSAGSAISEGFGLWEDDFGVLWLYTKHSANTLGRYDVTSMPPVNAILDADETYSIGLRNTISIRGDTVYAETVSRGANSMKHAFTVFSLPSMVATGQLQFSPFVTPPTDSATYLGKLPKRQGFASGLGFFAGGFGGHRWLADEVTPYSDYGVKLWNSRGDLLSKCTVKSDLLSGYLIAAGYDILRTENEGCFVDDQNTVYSAMVYSVNEASAEKGWLLFEHFSTKPDAMDWSGIAAAETPAYDNNTWRPVRAPNNTPDHNGMTHPIYGTEITDLSQIADFLYAFNIGRAEFYTTSFPLVKNFDGTDLPGSSLVVVVNRNNLSAHAVLMGGYGVRHYLWNSGAVTNWSNRVPSTGIGATFALDLAGTGEPEGVVSAPVGSTYRRLDGTPGNTFYGKESGAAGNTGWVAK